jgi:hypothetical protein
VAGGINSVNGALNVAGNGGFYNGSNKFGVDNNAGASRLYASGPNSSTRGSYEFHITDSTGALDTIAAYINTSGNFGLGITPNSWASGATALQVGSSGAVWERASDNLLVLASNTYFDGGADRYIKNGYASRMYQLNGAFYWETAVSGTAGAATPLSSTMTLTSAKRLGIGTTGPVTKLHISDPNGNNGHSSDNSGLVLVESTYSGASGDTNASLVAKNYYGYSQFMQWESNGLRFGVRSVANGGAGAIVFTSGNDVEGMRLTSANNFLIGTTSAGGKFHVKATAAADMTCRLEPYTNAYASKLLISSQSSGDGGMQYGAGGGNDLNIFGYGNITFLNGSISGGIGTERMRLDSSGNLGLGRTDPPLKLSVSAAGAVINGTATIGSNMQGIQIYNTTSATTNNAVGLWLTVGPHQTGIAAFRPTPDTTWSTALAFYTHGAATSGLNDCYERMRISGEGNVSIGGTGEIARLSVAGTSAAIALEAFKSDGFARTIQICAGLSGNYNTLTIEVNLQGAGGYCYELNSGGTSGGYMATGGGYINSAANFSHILHTSGGSSGASLAVSCPSGNIVRWVLTGGSGIHPVCTFKITGSLSQYFTASDITVVYS